MQTPNEETGFQRKRQFGSEAEQDKSLRIKYDFESRDDKKQLDLL